MGSFQGLFVSVDRFIDRVDILQISNILQPVELEKKKYTSSLYHFYERSTFEVHFVKLNQYFNVNLKYTSSILEKNSRRFLGFICRSGLLYGQSSINCRLQSHSEYFLLTSNSLILIRLNYEGGHLMVLNLGSMV